MLNRTTPWHPYLVLWSYGQVLKNGERDDCCPLVLVEIRRLYRSAELPEAVHAFIPSSCDLKAEEIFESADVIHELPATQFHLLGPVDLLLGSQDKPCKPRASSSDFVAAVTCRCKYFYITSVQRFQPLFCFSFSPEMWFQRLLERGFNHGSKILKEHKSLGDMTFPAAAWFLQQLARYSDSSQYQNGLPGRIQLHVQTIQDPGIVGIWHV